MADVDAPNVPADDDDAAGAHTESNSRIAKAIKSAKEYLGAHTDEARYRDSIASAVVVDGLRVRVTGPDGSSLETDMVAAVGGTGSAPSPGWLLRAAYASCAATLIVMRAAEQGVDLSGLQVDVDSESDDRGILGISEDVSVGPASMRVAVRVGAASDEAAVRTIVEWGLEHCPVHDAVRRAVPVELDLRIG